MLTFQQMANFDQYNQSESYGLSLVRTLGKEPNRNYIDTYHACRYLQCGTTKYFAHTFGVARAFPPHYSYGRV